MKNEFYAYHTVTDKPMYVGQHIIYDETHYNGVHKRVYEKFDLVNQIYSDPDKFDAKTLEHHTRVALRELALEKVRLAICPEAPSRMRCLYVSETIAEAEQWAESFVNWGRPTYSIVKLKIKGNKFVGDSYNCFDATLNEQENLLLAKRYWNNEPNQYGKEPIKEILVNGDIEVVEIIKEINTNLNWS